MDDKLVMVLSLVSVAAVNLAISCGVECLARRLNAKPLGPRPTLLAMPPGMTMAASRQLYVYFLSTRGHPVCVQISSSDRASIAEMLEELLPAGADRRAVREISDPAPGYFKILQGKTMPTAGQEVDPC
jgi:hypothetical protein